LPKGWRKPLDFEQFERLVYFGKNGGECFHCA
jgi:hypothetical protein